MITNKDSVEQIAQVIAQADNDKEYYYDIDTGIIIESDDELISSQRNTNWLKIEPLLTELSELMEDFSLEQENEEVQKDLLKAMSSKNLRTNIENFKRIIHNYPRSKKRWQILETKWLKQKAKEFIEDAHL